MSQDPQTVLQAAMTLSPGDRLRVAAELLASVDGDDDPSPAQSAWAEEIDARIARAKSGNGVLSTWADVESRLRKKHFGA